MTDDSEGTPLELLMESAFNARLAELERLRTGKQAEPEPSHCPTCGHRIKRDLVKGKRLVHLERVK